MVGAADPPIPLAWVGRCWRVVQWRLLDWHDRSLRDRSSGALGPGTTGPLAPRADANGPLVRRRCERSSRTPRTGTKGDFARRDGNERSTRTRNTTRKVPSRAKGTANGPAVPADRARTVPSRRALTRTVLSCTRPRAKSPFAAEPVQADPSRGGVGAKGPLGHFARCDGSVGRGAGANGPFACGRGVRGPFALRGRREGDGREAGAGARGPVVQSKWPQRGEGRHALAGYGAISGPH